MKLPLAALVVAYMIFFACLGATMSELPSRVASHFDIVGRANGWMDRGSYLAFTLGMALGLPIFMIVLAAVTGRLGRGINIPNRDYWLAPERRQKTIAALMRFVVVLCAIVVLLVTAVHLLVSSNTGSAPPRLGPAIRLVFTAFLAVAITWIVMLRRRFARMG